MMNTTEVVTQMLKDELSIEVELIHPYDTLNVTVLEVTLLLDNTVISVGQVELPEVDK